MLTMLGGDKELFHTSISHLEIVWRSYLTYRWVLSGPFS